MGLIDNLLSIFIKQEKELEPQIQKSSERLEQEKDFKKNKNFC